MLSGFLRTSSEAWIPAGDWPVKASLKTKSYIAAADKGWYIHEGKDAGFSGQTQN